MRILVIGREKVGTARWGNGVAGGHEEVGWVMGMDLAVNGEGMSGRQDWRVQGVKLGSARCGIGEIRLRRGEDGLGRMGIGQTGDNMLH